MATFSQVYQQILLQDNDPIRKMELHSLSAGIEATAAALGIRATDIMAITATRHQVSHSHALAKYQALAR